MTSVRTNLVVDAHAHFHACFSAREFFRWATANAATIAATEGWVAGHDACVFLTDGSTDQGFAGLQTRFGSDADGWRAERTNEATSFRVRAQAGPNIFVLAGTQIVCAERLEVLALGARLRDLDGHPLTSVIAAVRAAGAIPVLPWGVGKWIGARGALVRNTLRDSVPGSLALGDNGGRWSGLGTPREFSMAENRGIVVLPGTDPLPFAREVRRVCNYGFTLQGEFDADFPTRSVLGLLAALAQSPVARGQRVGLGTFVRNQLALRLRGNASGRF